MNESDKALLSKINKAVAAANEAEKSVATAQVELVSRSKQVGLLLLEAKKRHPKVADFEAFLKRVDGLGLTRAYDCMRIAGGRITDEELRQQERDRKRKTRAKKKLPPAAPAIPIKPEPDSGTVPESGEAGPEKRIRIGPIDRCTMAVRSTVLEIMREMKSSEWTELLAALRDELDDLEGVARRRAEAA